MGYCSSGNTSTDHHPAPTQRRKFSVRVPAVMKKLIRNRDFQNWSCGSGSGGKVIFDKCFKIGNRDPSMNIDISSIIMIKMIRIIFEVRHLTDAHPFRKHLRGPPKQAQEREQKSTPASKPVRPQEAKAQGFRSEPRRASPEAS